MSSIVLIRPASGRSAEFFASEHLGLASVAASLRAAGHEVGLHDMTLDDSGEEGVLRLLDMQPPDAVGVTVTDGPMLEAARMLIRRSRSAGHSQPWVAGGYLPTFHAAELLTAVDAPDLVVVGEGERSAVQLASGGFRRESWSTVPGVAWHDGHSIRLNAPAPPLELDALPFAARDHLGEVIARGGTPTLAATRGCPWRCSFCQIGPFYDKSGARHVRFRDPARVVDEVERLLGTGIVKFVSFVDEVFFGGRASRGRVERFIDEVRRRQLDFRFGIETRPDQIDAETVGALAEIGLTVVSLGIESGNESTLRYLGKGFTLAQTHAAVDVLVSEGLLISSGFILYGPRTTPDEIEADIGFLERLPFAVMNPHALGILSGTALAVREPTRYWADRLEHGYDVADPVAARFVRWFDRYAIAMGMLPVAMARWILAAGAGLPRAAEDRHRFHRGAAPLTSEFRRLQTRGLRMGLEWARSSSPDLPDDALQGLACAAEALARRYTSAADDL